MDGITIPQMTTSSSLLRSALAGQTGAREAEGRPAEQTLPAPSGTTDDRAVRVTIIETGKLIADEADSPFRDDSAANRTRRAAGDSSRETLVLPGEARGDEGESERFTVDAGGKIVEENGGGGSKTAPENVAGPVPSPGNAGEGNEGAAGAAGNDKSALDQVQEMEIKRLTQEMARKDHEVRAEESAKAALLGRYSKGGPRYQYETGPNGERFAVSGHVPADLAPTDDPERTLRKARTVKQANLGVGANSPEDMKIAARAMQLESTARAHLVRKGLTEVLSVYQPGGENGTRSVEAPPLPRGNGLLSEAPRADGGEPQPVENTLPVEKKAAEGEDLLPPGPLEGQEAVDLPGIPSDAKETGPGESKGGPSVDLLA